MECTKGRNSGRPITKKSLQGCWHFFDKLYVQQRKMTLTYRREFNKAIPYNTERDEQCQRTLIPNHKYCFQKLNWEELIQASVGHKPLLSVLHQYWDPQQSVHMALSLYLSVSPDHLKKNIQLSQKQSAECITSKREILLR